MQQAVYFPRIARTTYQHPENISGHAGMSLLVVILSKISGIVIWNFHSLYTTPQITVSVKKWRQLAEDKAEFAEQEQQIRQKFKMNRIKKEFGQLWGEEIFKPITKRLDKATKEPEPAEEPAEEREYGMDEFDRLNPFDEEFRPNAETPPPSPIPSSPTITNTNIRGRWCSSAAQNVGGASGDKLSQ